MVQDPLSLLERVGLDPSGWSITDLPHNRWLTPGIWQLERGDERVVVKWLSTFGDSGSTPWENHWTLRSDEPKRWNFWAREPHAFQSNLVGSFSGEGMMAPRCLGVDVGSGDAVVVLEFVDGVPAEHWSIEQYAHAAHALGVAQASYATGQRPFPEVDWLSQGFLRDYSTEKPVDWGLLDDDRAWNQPLIIECFPSELRGLATELHGQSDRLLGIVEGLPRTLCHLDFWTKNLISASDGTVTLLDWAFFGVGAIGEDIGNLVPDSSFDHFVPSAQLPELDAAAFDAYTRGLATGGWSGDSDLVQLAVWASAVKYDWLTPFMLASASAARQMTYGGAEEVDAAFRFRERGEVLLFNARRAILALDLASKLSL